MRCYRTSLTVCCQTAKKEDKLGLNDFVQKLSSSRDGPEKVQKRGRDENTRRQSCCRRVVVKKDWNTTIHLLPDYATEVKWSISVCLPRLFCSRIVFLHVCFHPLLVSVLLFRPTPACNEFFYR